MEEFICPYSLNFMNKKSYSWTYWLSIIPLSLSVTSHVSQSRMFSGLVFCHKLHLASPRNRDTENSFLRLSTYTEN